MKIVRGNTLITYGFAALDIDRIKTGASLMPPRELSRAPNVSHVELSLRIFTEYRTAPVDRKNRIIVASRKIITRRAFRVTFDRDNSNIVRWHNVIQ